MTVGGEESKFYLVIKDFMIQGQSLGFKICLRGLYSCANREIAQVVFLLFSVTSSFLWVSGTFYYLLLSLWDNVTFSSNEQFRI